MSDPNFRAHWMYHASGAKRLIERPEHEPQGPDWASQPFPPKVKVVDTVDSLKVQVEDLTAALSEKSEAVTAKQAEIDSLIARFDLQWITIVAERDALSAEVDRLRAKLATKAKPPKVAPEPAEPQAE